jgi:hypothetical protein
MIVNKKYERPRDMFEAACLLIVEQLEEYGFKYSKSQASIKKKDKLFVYEIYFGSSRYNYIYENEGHVVMTFCCRIIDKQKNAVFYVSPRELRSLEVRYELFDNANGTIDLKQVEIIKEFIKNHFLTVVFAIEIDVSSALEAAAENPNEDFEDYFFMYYDKFFTNFNRHDLIAKYNEKIAEAKAKKPEIDKMFFKKYLSLRFDYDKLSKFCVEELKPTLQKFYSSTNYEEWIEGYYDAHKKLFEKLSNSEASDKNDWLTDYYSFLCYCSDSIKDNDIRNHANEIKGRFLKCFKE